MKSRRNLWGCAAAALVAYGIAGLQTSRAQPLPDDPAQGGPGNPNRGVYGQPVGPPIDQLFAGEQPVLQDQGRRGPLSLFRPSQPSPLEGEIRKAAQSLRDAETDDEKTAATQQLTGALERYFDEDLRHRGEELARMEKRLADLRAQLDRRKSKRQEIINAQLTLTVNEADGLGFFSRPGQPPAGDLFSDPFINRYGPAGPGDRGDDDSRYRPPVNRQQPNQPATGGGRGGPPSRAREQFLGRDFDQPIPSDLPGPPAAGRPPGAPF